MKDAALKPALMLGPHPRAGVLLPLPLRGAYDYKLPKGTEVARGLLVVAPLGSRETLGVVWGEAEGISIDACIQQVLDKVPADK